MAELYCDVCGNDASNPTDITRWHDTNVCTKCLAGREALDEAMGSDECDCIACLCIQRKHRMAFD
jgi:hypothetical protein